MKLGNKILELRKSHNLSQEQLAEKLQVSRQTISKWELNETVPDIKQAQKLAKLFGVSLDNLTSNQNIKEHKIKGFKYYFFMVTYIIFALYFISSLISLIVSLFSFETTIITKLGCKLDNNNYNLKFNRI